MPKNILVKINSFVCLVIVIGFGITALINYNSSREMYMSNMEHISSLTTEGIYYRLESIFAKPVNVSLTMANDSFLIDFLSEETERLSDNEFIQTMSEYLDAYRIKYDYDSVFLVSAKSNRYYNFKGIDRVLDSNNPENDWYYDFLENETVYSLNVDNDEAASNEITVFINCGIRDKDGIIGIVGVGFQIDYLQALLQDYETEFGIETFLVSEKGDVEISTEFSGYEYVDHFSTSGYPHLKAEILAEKDKALTYWLEEEKGRNYIVTKYIPDMSWHLIVENNTQSLDRQMNLRLLSDLLIVIVIVFITLVTITVAIRSFKRRIVQLTEENQKAFRNATEQLFDNIYEINITKDRAAGKSTRHYFRSLGLSQHSPYSETLKTIAEKQLKQEYQEEYLRLLSPENILSEFEKGNTSLQFEFETKFDGDDFKWSRINAHVYHNKEDDSIRMFTYRQNIESEKQKEIEARTDSLTGLYNKLTTENLIRQELAEEKDAMYAFIIADIDDFKQVNDNFGHKIGDQAILRFSKALKRNFRHNDIIGRIGGDEFVVFLQVPSVRWVEEKISTFAESLDIEFSNSENHYRMTTSIGVALSPIHGNDFETLYKNADTALYKTKEIGKNGSSIYSSY